MFILRKCCTRPLNCFHVVAQFNNLKSCLAYLSHNRNFVVGGSEPHCITYSYVTNINKSGYSSILMPRIQDYIKNCKSISTRSFKSKASASAEPQGIHENVFALQTRTRLQRRKRPPLVEEDSKKLGVWYAGLKSTLIAYLVINILSYPTVVQFRVKKRLISQTLLNDWHSTVLHVSIPKESLLGSSYRTSKTCVNFITRALKYFKCH